MEQKSVKKIIKVLLITYETRFGLNLKNNLKPESFIVDIKRNRKKVLHELSVFPYSYNLLVIDIGHPFTSEDGINFCQSVRSQLINIPILVLIDELSIEERILILDSGADEYITKPFALKDLIIVIKKMASNLLSKEPALYEIGNITYDLNIKKIWKKNKEINLTSKEFAIFEYLVTNLKQDLSREAIFNHVWNYESHLINNVIDVHIKNIRKKISGKRRNNLIKTVRGYGYRLG